MVDLPLNPSLESPTTYDVFVSGDYEASALRAETSIVERGMAYIESSLDSTVWGPTSIQ